MTLRGRTQIERITPSVDCGRHAVRAVVGDRMTVEADVFREGHGLVTAVVQYRGPSYTQWQEEPLRLDVSDRWEGSFLVDEIGSWRYQIVGWTDHYASWLDGVRKKYAAGQGSWRQGSWRQGSWRQGSWGQGSWRRVDLDVDLEEGARLLERRPAPESRDLDKDR